MQPLAKGGKDLGVGIYIAVKTLIIDPIYAPFFALISTTFIYCVPKIKAKFSSNRKYQK
jgi:hypothetical protein